MGRSYQRLQTQVGELVGGGQPRGPFAQRVVLGEHLVQVTDTPFARPGRYRLGEHALGKRVISGGYASSQVEEPLEVPDPLPRLGELVRRVRQSGSGVELLE